MRRLQQIVLATAPGIFVHAGGTATTDKRRRKPEETRKSNNGDASISVAESSEHRIAGDRHVFTAAPLSVITVLEGSLSSQSRTTTKTTSHLEHKPTPNRDKSPSTTSSQLTSLLSVSTTSSSSSEPRVSQNRERLTTSSAAPSSIFISILTINIPSSTSSSSSTTSTQRHADTLTGIQTVVPTYPPFTSSSSSSSSSSSQYRNSLATKLGLGLGIPLLILLVILLVACLHLHQRRRQKHRLFTQTPPFDFDAPEMVPVSVADFAYLRESSGGAATTTAAGIGECRARRSSSIYSQPEHRETALAAPAPIVPRRSSARLQGGGRSGSSGGGGGGVPHLGPLSSHPLQVPLVQRVAWDQGSGGSGRGGGVGGQGSPDLGALYASYFDGPQQSHGPWDPEQAQVPPTRVPMVQVDRQSEQTGQRQGQRWQYLSVDVNSSAGGIDEVSPLSSSGSAPYVPRRISAVSAVDKLSPRS